MVRAFHWAESLAEYTSHDVGDAAQSLLGFLLDGVMQRFGHDNTDCSLTHARNPIRFLIGMQQLFARKLCLTKRALKRHDTSMATHGHGRGRKGISFSVPDWLDTELRKAAKASNLSVNAYVNALLDDALRRGVLVREKREVYTVDSKDKKS